MKDVSDLTLEQVKDENKRLGRELTAAMLTIEKLLKDANLKREEISHLTSLVAQAVPVFAVAKAPGQEEKTDAQVIAEKQLSRLRDAAVVRTLTLEEVRIYDFLVKNQRLAGLDPDEGKDKNPGRDVSEIELIRIAESSFKPNHEN